MKRAVVLLSAMSLIFLSLTAVSAQVQVDKPVLPEGYESWSYTKTYTCIGSKETVWAKADKEKNTLKILAMTEANGQVIAYDYIEGDFNKPKFANAFLMQDRKWLKFNGMNDVQYSDFLDRRDDALMASGATSDCLDKIDGWYDDIVNELLTILKTKN